MKRLPVGKRKRVHCAHCNETWTERFIKGVPVSVWIAQIKMFRCPSCDRGFQHLEITTISDG